MIYVSLPPPVGTARQPQALVPTGVDDHTGVWSHCRGLPLLGGIHQGEKYYYYYTCLVSTDSPTLCQAKSLSRKIVMTYRLCSQQLSDLNHYDYGMRAVRAVIGLQSHSQSFRSPHNQVLDAATKIKMTHEEDDEEKIILKAIMDVNLPKFSSSDCELFQVQNWQ